MTDAAAADYAPGLELAFELPEEAAGPVAAVHGEIPGWLRGTAYWNGPARFARGTRRYRHWLDGDGMVAALRFGGAGAAVHFTNRFVRSTKWLAEEAAGEALFRTFGTRFPGDRLARGIALESPVNVSVVPYAGTLLACGEQGLPWELDPDTLATRGPFTFGGALNPVTPFAAHAKIDPATGELFNFGLSYASRRPGLHLYRCRPDGTLAARRRAALDLPVSIHDFILAPRHLIFHVSPYCLDLDAVTGQGACLLEALRWEPQRAPSELLIFPRADLAAAADATAADLAPIRVALDRGYCLHGIAAGEDRAGRLVVDFLELDRPVYDQYRDVPALLPKIGPGRPVRLILDPATATLRGRQAAAYEAAPDFPVTVPRADGAPHPDLWMLGIAAAGRGGRKFYDQLVHVRWQRAGAPTVWQAPAGRYLTGEPALAAPPDGAAGAPLLLCPFLDAPRAGSGYLLFDADRIAAGPRAEILLGRPLPPAFHGAFAAAAAT